MEKTSTEELINQIKRSSRSEAILVPLIESFMRIPLEIDDDEDRWFLQQLVLARSQKRKKGIYSPSMLATCVRQVYLVQKQTKGKRIERTAASGYFLDGNFRHFKWQFAMWKMHRAGIIQLIDTGSICIGTEIPVFNERRDFGGTIDNLIFIPGEDIICTVDWKGANANGFNRMLVNGPSLQYIVQSVGYGKLANSSLPLYHPDSYDPNHPPEAQKDAKRIKIKDILIIGENKNGPVFNRKVHSPLGLLEWRISIAEQGHHVDKRMKDLRRYARDDEMPPFECKSTRTQMFKDCAFSAICRGEIEAAEKKQLRTKQITKPQVQTNRKKKL